MEETLQDLRDDFAEISFLASAGLKKVEQYDILLKKNRSHYSVPSFEYLYAEAMTLSTSYEEVLTDVVQELANKASWSGEDVSRLLKKKKTYAELLRILQSSLGSVLSAGNWQSPSFAHTLLPQAGNETNDIKASQNDYKRDLFEEASKYTAEFVKEYVPHPLRLPPRAYITSSGMAAVTTVLTYLLPKVKEGEVILVGKSSYFQNKWAAQNIFFNKVIYVDEFDTEKIIALAKEHQPPVILLDSLGGAQTLPTPHLERLIPELGRVLSSHSTFVLDNTALSVGYQVLRDLPLSLGGMQLIVVESLLKYYQFGFDRVNGGVIWAPLGMGEGLFEARMHLGTIIPEASAFALPPPNRLLLERRLARIGRNALFLAQNINAIAQEKNSIISHVVYPGLSSYEGFSWSSKRPFQGGFFVLVFKPPHQNIKDYDAFVARVLAIAKKMGVDLIGGTSFGFNTTRIYITARYATNITEPYIRISAGTETKEEVDKLFEVFRSAIHV